MLDLFIHENMYLILNPPIFYQHQMQLTILLMNFFELGVDSKEERLLDLHVLTMLVHKFCLGY